MAQRLSLKEKIFDILYRFKYGTVMFLVGIIVVFWDLLSKLITDGKTAEVLNGFFRVQSSHNFGGAWSILENNTWLLILLSILFICFMLVGNWFLKHKNYFYAISMGLVISGAIANLIDRIRFGYVRDFIRLEFIDFPIFNFADCAITLGITLLCVYFIFILPKYEKKESEILNINNEKEIASRKMNDDVVIQEFESVLENLDPSKKMENVSNEKVVGKSYKNKEKQPTKKNMSEASVSKNIQKGTKNKNTLKGTKTSQKTTTKSEGNKKSSIKTSDGQKKGANRKKGVSAKKQTTTKSKKEIKDE